MLYLFVRLCDLSDGIFVKLCCERESVFFHCGISPLLLLFLLYFFILLLGERNLPPRSALYVEGRKCPSQRQCFSFFFPLQMKKKKKTHNLKHKFPGTVLYFTELGLRSGVGSRQAATVVWSQVRPPTPIYCGYSSTQETR